MGAAAVDPILVPSPGIHERLDEQPEGMPLIEFELFKQRAQWLALATALERASAAGQWSTVEVLARELESRRKARAGAVQLDRERRKKREQ